MDWKTKLDKVLDQDHESKLDEIYLQHFVYDSPEGEKVITAEQLAIMAQGDAQARSLAASARPVSKKLTIYERDPLYVNGVPRRRG